MGGNFEGTKLEGADFTGAKFEFVDLTDVNLSEVKGLSIDQIKKEGVKYQESNLPANIRASLSSETHVKLP